MSRVYADQIDKYVDAICRGASRCGQRTGQWLFNHLPDGPSWAVCGELFDPFYKELTPRELKEWISNHLIFDGARIIAVFDGDRILWEES